MLIIETLKLICDLSLVLSFISALRGFSSAWIFMAVMPLSAAFCYYLSQKSDNRVIRILLGILPAVSVLLLKGVLQYVLGIIMCGYVFYAIAIRDDVIRYEDYKYIIGIPAVVVIIFTLIWTSAGNNNYLPALFAGIYLIGGVIVLRRKRMGEGLDNYGRLLNAASVTGVTFGILILLTALFGILSLSGSLMQILLLPIGFIIRGLIQVFMLLGKVFTYKNPDEPLIPEQSVDEVYEEIFNPEIDPVETTVDNSHMTMLLLERIVLVVLAVAILAVIVYALIRVFREVSGKNEKETDEYETGNGYEKISGTKKKKGKQPVSNRQKIRDIYREFLYLAKSRGVKLTKQTTSEEVAAFSCFNVDEAADKLREIYIRIRYKADSEVSDEDVSQAARCLKAIREKQ